MLQALGLINGLLAIITMRVHHTIVLENILVMELHL